LLAQAAPPPRQSKPTETTGSSARAGYEYSDPVNRFLGRFLPLQRDVTAELSGINFAAPKQTGLKLEELAGLLEQRLTATEWFVTGEVDPTLFADNFAFKDDSVATTGIQSYAEGVRKLFDQETARAELISVEPAPEKNAVVVVWRLEGRVNLPGRPTIPPYVVTTTLGTNSEGLINSQLDEFGAPGWQLLTGALLGAWAGPPPAPPAARLREEWLASKANNR